MRVWLSSATVGPCPHRNYSYLSPCQARFLAPREMFSVQNVSSKHAHTTREKGSFLMSKSVLFWYLRISRSATVPGRYRCFFRSRSGSGSVHPHLRLKVYSRPEDSYIPGRARGAIPPVLFLAVAVFFFLAGGGGLESELSSCRRLEPVARLFRLFWTV